MANVLKILVIDDDPKVAQSLERGLREHRPIVETDPAAAYRRLVSGEWFDAVLCDVTMPEISGQRLLAAVRELRDPPVFVLMSGDDVYDTNADAILHKPFPVTYVLDLLSIFARRRSKALTKRLPLVKTP